MYSSSYKMYSSAWEREEKGGLRTPVTHHLPSPGFACWALRWKVFKAFPCEWNSASKTLFFFPCSAPTSAPARNLLYQEEVQQWWLLMLCSAMPRMEKVLGWWLIFHAWKFHDFGIPFSASFWEAGKKERNSLCIGNGVLHFPDCTLCFRRAVKQSCDIPAWQRW